MIAVRRRKILKVVDALRVLFSSMTVHQILVRDFIRLNI